RRQPDGAGAPARGAVRASLDPSRAAAGHSRGRGAARIGQRRGRRRDGGVLSEGQPDRRLRRSQPRRFRPLRGWQGVFDRGGPRGAALPGWAPEEPVRRQRGPLRAGEGAVRSGGHPRLRRGLDGPVRLPGARNFREGSGALGRRVPGCGPARERPLRGRPVELHRGARRPAAAFSGGEHARRDATGPARGPRRDLQVPGRRLVARAAGDFSGGVPMTEEPNETVAPGAWRTLGWTSLAVFMTLLDTTILFVAFPSIRASFP